MARLARIIEVASFFFFLYFNMNQFYVSLHLLTFLTMWVPFLDSVNRASGATRAWFGGIAVGGG
jgi:hypothetical protein